MPQERQEKRIDQLPKFTEIADDAMFPFEQGGIAGYGEARLIKNYNKGEKGDKGDKGDTGETGAKGDKGDSGGQPIPVTLASQMVNTQSVYLYLGQEQGYDYGYVYAYINGSWEKTLIYGKGEDGQGSVPIDLGKYGIVAADFSEPFTESNYRVAYQNGLGIQAAIDDAISAGIPSIILPPGNYPICYHASTNDEKNPIIDARGINLYGYGAKLYVIYDEEGTNPYFTGETARLLMGTIILTDHDVCGFHIVGERGFRKNENTKYRDSSKGIALDCYCCGNKIKDCIVELISGDGICCERAMDQSGGWENETFTSVVWNNSQKQFVADQYHYTSTRHQNWMDQSKPLLVRSSSYFIYAAAPLEALCFDANEEYIGRVSFYQGEYFYLLPNTEYWYLQITRNVAHDTSTTETYSWWIGYGYYTDTEIDNCISRYNQRGGMSNLPNNSIVKNCKIYLNGAEFNGMPAYHDNTRFGIDIEDVWINRITVMGTHIYGNVHGLLWRCREMNIVDCYIIGYVGSMNYCVNFYAKGSVFASRFYMTYPTPFGKKVAIGCQFDNSVPNEVVIVDENQLPSGGLTGQFLTKASDNDYDFTWVSVSSANGVSF